MKLVFLVRLEGSKQKPKMKKSIHNQISFRQMSLEIISRSNVLTIPSAFQKLKRRFKVQRLNDFLFAFKMNLSKRNINIVIKELRMSDFLIAPGDT